MPQPRENTAELTVEGLCAGVADIPADVLGFAHTSGTRVVFGDGALARLGEICAGLGARRVLIVTDAGILKAGHVDRARESLELADIDVTVHAEVRENPDTNDVDACVEVARACSADVLIGLGGGSSIDTAKGCNFLLTNGGAMRDYWGSGKAKKPMLPMVAVPTTAGTGSECQSFALIADANSHRKMACGDKKAAAAVAILDPSLTLTQPHAVTAHTGIDAMAHAIETAVTRRRNTVSSAYARAAFALLDRGIDAVADNPASLEARARMQVGAALAGTAIENSMLGAAHAAANPLTAHLDTVHGVAVGIMLPHVIRHNADRDPASAEIYRELFPGDLAARVEQVLDRLEMPATLEAGTSDRAQLAREAAAQWTARFNPVPLEPADFEALYAKVLR